MWKKALLASAALALAGTTFVYAQRFGGPDGPGPMRGFERFRPSADDLAAFADARVAAMKAGLRLSAEQEKNWPAFEQAYRNLATLRAERMMASRSGDQTPPQADLLDRMQRRADAMTRRAAAFRQISDATAPLYRSLDEAQKQRFTILARMMNPMRGQRGMMDRGRRGPGEMRRGEFAPGPLQRGGMEQPAGASREGPLERIHYNGQPFGNYTDGKDIDAAR